MAYIVSTAQYSLNAASTNLTLALPDHATDDVIVFFAALDSGTATATGTTTGAWTDIGNTTHTNGTGSSRYRRMTSGSEIFQLTTTDAWSLVFVCVRDVDTTTALDATPNASNNNSTSPAPVNVTVSAANANTLSLYMVGGALVAAQIHSPPGFMSIASLDSTGTTATTSANMGVCWYFNRATGNVPVPTWFGSASDTYVRYTVLLRNRSGGRIPAYIDDVSSPAESLCMGHTQTVLDYGGGNVTPTATLTNPNAQINSTTPTGSLATLANSADFGVNPYSTALGNAANTASTTYYGFEITYATARNASTGIICGAYICNTPKVAAFGLGNTKQGGGVFRIASSTTAWAAYQVVAKDSLPNPVGRYVFGIQAGYTGTVYGNQGTAVTTSSITATQSFANFPSFTGILFLSELYIVKTQIVAGGDATNPVSNDGMVSIGSSFRLPVIQKQGGSGLLSYAPIQIGGGDAVNFQLDGGVLQFPRRYNATTRELSWHAADNAVGISYYGISGDTIKHTNSSITSLTPYYWEIHSSATSAATWDFTGLSIYNGTVTLRVAANAGFNRMSFTSCPVLTATSCSVTNSTFSSNPSVAGTSGTFTGCTFSSNTTVTATSGSLLNCTLSSNTTVTAGGTTITGTNFNTNTTVTTTTATIGTSNFVGNATIALSGSTVTGSTFTSLPAGNNTISVDASTSFSSCSFNTTTLTAGNSPIVTTFAIFDGLFANCTFTGSGSGGHAVEVTSSGTTSFVGNVFTSYGATGTTSAAIYNNSGGLLTINVSGGGNSPTYRNGVGATTVVNAGSVTATVNVKDADGANLQNARVFVKAATGGPLPFDATVTISNSGTTATVTHASHGMATSDKVVISGASLEENNGVFTITFIDSGSYSYTMGSSPGSSPTGTIKCTFVALSGLTDASGNITMGRVFSADQPVSGWARKSTSAPFFRTGSIGGTIDSDTGFTTSIQLILDQ